MRPQTRRPKRLTQSSPMRRRVALGSAPGRLALSLSPIRIPTPGGPVSTLRQLFSALNYKNTGSTATAVAYDCSGVYVETDY